MPYLVMLHKKKKKNCIAQYSTLCKNDLIDWKFNISLAEKRRKEAEFTRDKHPLK